MTKPCGKIKSTDHAPRAYIQKNDFTHVSQYNHIGIKYFVVQEFFNFIKRDLKGSGKINKKILNIGHNQG